MAAQNTAVYNAASTYASFSRGTLLQPRPQQHHHVCCCQKILTIPPLLFFGVTFDPGRCPLVDVLLNIHANIIAHLITDAGYGI